ncbi:MAG: helix-turn-helix transcriptional regulator [Marinilabiliaceae bacterium]|nr:helix-turn-helix transcriptional regulator [Marinilabiliaceae bacterium]
MINQEVLTEARRQIGLLLRNLRNGEKIGTKKLSKMTGLTETQILDIELNRRNYTIDSFLKVIQALDMYFFLSEKEGHHLDFEHMVKKSNPDEAAL